VHAHTTHASLLARLVDHEDRSAWDEFLARYSALLRGFARRRGLSSHEADDVVQDVVTALVSALPTFEYDRERGRFRGLLKTIAVRAIARRREKDARSAPLGDRDVAVDPEADDAWETEWRQYHMRLAMRTIEAEFGPRDRAAFERYALRGEGVRETAEALGLSVDQVYQAKSRITRRLSEVISAQIEDEG